MTSEVNGIQSVLFFVFSFILIASAFGVVWHKNPVKSALFLIAFFVGLAMTYALLGADFLAALQVLVYVGAIMVLFLFVIMLISVRDASFENFGSGWLKNTLMFFLLVSFLLQFFVLLQIGDRPPPPVNLSTGHSLRLPSQEIISGNSEVISFHLFASYLLPFEVVSILLLVAVIGAVVLAKKDRRRLE